MACQFCPAPERKPCQPRNAAISPVLATRAAHARALVLHRCNRARCSSATSNLRGTGTRPDPDANRAASGSCTRPLTPAQDLLYRQTVSDDNPHRGKNTDHTAGAGNARWIGLAVGLAVSVLDILAASALGITFAISGADATLWIWAYLALSFGGVGYLIGWLHESRRRERRARVRVGEQLDLLHALRVRLSEREKLAALGQLAATIAHEVRNPLAIMRSTLQNIREDIAEARPAIAEQHGFLLEEIDRLNRVLTTVLDHARPMRLEMDSLPASELFERVAFLASGLLQPKGLSLDLNDRDADIALRIDPDLMCQALLGLVTNGIEATPHGESLALAARVDDRGIELSVADRGPGVPEDQRGKIFEPFFTTKNTGNGLGLAVAQRIAEAHDGTIAVEDRRDGKGARFVVRLPAPAGQVLP